MSSDSSSSSSSSASSKASNNPDKQKKQKEDADNEHGQNKKTTDEVMKERFQNVLKSAGVLAAVVIGDTIMNLVAGGSSQIVALLMACGVSMLVPVMGYYGSKWGDDIMLGLFSACSGIQAVAYLFLLLQSTGSIGVAGGERDRIEENEELSTTTTTAKPVEELGDLERTLHIVFLTIMMLIAAFGFWNGYNLYKHVQKMNAGTLTQYHNSRGSLVMARVSEVTKRLSARSSVSSGGGRKSVGAESV